MSSLNCYFLSLYVSSSLPRLRSVPGPVPGLVDAEPRHLRQDEQVGEQEGHLPGHGDVPCQVSQR